MSAVESVGPFRLGERVGTSVWKAEDTRSGKAVALKLLTKQLPKDQAKRDALVREVRLAAALYHAFIVTIIEITPVGDALIMIMELVEGRRVSSRVSGQPLDRTTFFRTSYQIAEGLKFLHGKGFVHQNLNGDSVLLTSEGQVKLAGFNLMNLLPRRDGTGPSAFQQKGNDIRSVSYMAPEQITGQPIEARTDLFSLGSIMYEMGTGKLPFAAANAPDAARKIVEGQPPSPKVANPSIDAGVMNAMGACLFKDMYKRPKDARALVDLLAKLDPDSAKFASDFATRITTTSSGTAEGGTPRHAILFIADVANFEELAAKDATVADKAAARMQQILGEAVYLYDGQVVDPFGPRMIAELGSVAAAVDAAKKGEFDFSPDQQEGEPISVRLLLHAGNVRTKDGHVVGECIDQAQKILAQLPPMKVFMSESFARESKGTIPVKDAGAKGGAKLFTLAGAAAAQPKPAGPTPEETAAREEEEAAAAEAEAATQKKRKIMLIAISAGVLAVILALVVVFMRGGRKPVAQTTTSTPFAASAPSQPVVKKVSLEPFTVEGNDPKLVLAERAKAVRLATAELFRGVPNVALVDGTEPDIHRFGAVLRVAAPPGTGPEIVPADRNAPELVVPPSPAPDNATAIQALVPWIASQLKVPPPALPATPDALNGFADALALADTDPAKADTALRNAVKSDPNFLPAQLFAMRYFATRSEPDSVEAARQVFARDPRNLDAARRVALSSLNSGKPGEALAAYKAILEVDTNNEEALTLIARYAASVRDTEKFAAAIRRLRFLPPQAMPVHEPDFLFVNGKVDAAVDRYYDIEAAIPNNPHLSLKIGRIAILRRTLPIAELELKKLQELDPNYGYYLLKAFLDAQQGSRAEAEADLKAAESAMKPGDIYWTVAAEIFAIFADNDKVIAALDKAAGRSEPSSSYINSDPLFEYLQSDERYRAILDRFSTQQQEIRAALAQIAL